MRLRTVGVVAALLLAGLFAPAAATARGIPLERLDRGLVAATTSEGVFLSWRLLGSEATGHSATGLTGTNFHVHRDGRRIATVTDSTNYLDKAGAATSKYRVTPVKGGPAATATPWATSHHDLPLQKPADGVTPAGRPTPTPRTT